MKRKTPSKAEAPEMPLENAMGKQYYARRPFGYMNTSLDRGQIFELGGALNDEKLVRLGYCAELPADAPRHQCAECGALFVGINERTAHGDKRHVERTPEEEERLFDREERQLEQVAPLFLDKTIASQGLTPLPA